MGAKRTKGRQALIFSLSLLNRPAPQHLEGDVPTDENAQVSALGFKSQVPPGAPEARRIKAQDPSGPVGIATDFSLLTPRPET